MPSLKVRFLAFVAVAGLLALLSTQAASRYDGGDTPGEHPGINPCTSKLAYEASVALAEAANIQYQRLKEPEWDKLSYKGRGGDPRANPAEFLRDLKAELATARAQAAQAGNPNPQQAEQNYQAALKRFEDVNEKYVAKTTQTSKLAREIQALMAEMQKIDDLIAKNPVKAATKEDQDRKAKIKEYETTVSATQTDLQNLIFDKNKNEEFDVDIARARIADPKFENFTSAKLAEIRRIHNDTPPASAEFNAIDGRLTKAIEEARQDARKMLAEYSAASRALSKLQSSDVNDDNANVESNDQLRRQKAAKQKQLEAKTTQKAQLGLQKPMGEDLKAAFEKLTAAQANRTAAQKNQVFAQKAHDLTNDVKLVEPWITARLVRNGTEARMKKARAEYSIGIRMKDERVGEVRAQFNALQNWITAQRDGLKGREQDDEYWKTVSGIKSRAGAEYSEMEAALSGMDCFPDVADLLSDIRARRKNLAAIRIGKAVKKPSPAKKKPPKVAGSGSNLAGWWVWLRGSDRVPMILEKNEKGQFTGVYFPGITTKNIERNKGPVVQIGFAPAGGNKFRYRYKYPGDGSKGGRGGGVMTLSGNRLTGPWQDDTGGGKGTWTLERATDAEYKLLKSKIGNRG